MDPGSFNGEQDINKSEIVISNHAAARFLDHIRKNQDFFKRIPSRHWDKFIGFTPVVVPRNISSGRELIRQLLNRSSHIDAVNRFKRTTSALEHKQNVFFLRYGRWQFRILYDKGMDKFVLVTVLWLDEKSYSLCFQ